METDIKYVVVYNYKKRIRGVERDITKMIECEDSKISAKDTLIKDSIRHNRDIRDYHISIWDWNKNPIEKLQEIRFDG